MATVYSLVCWGGRTGKSVTASNSSGLIFTSTNHGLRDGTALQFTATVLPGNVAAATTYYAKSLSANTFSIYTEAALTNRVAWSSAGTAVVAKSKKMIDYFAAYSGRWGAAGSERCYDGLAAWNTGRSAATPLDVEVCEIGESFADAITTSLTINVPSASVRIETKVRGIRTSAFHYGIVGSGYALYQATIAQDVLRLSSTSVALDGITVTVGSGWYASVLLAFTSFAPRVQNCIFIGQGGTAAIGSYGYIYITQAGTVFSRNAVYGAQRGVYISSYLPGLVIAGNTITKCGIGFHPANSTNMNGYYYNNISIGNTTNWGTATGQSIATNNFGLDGEAWMAGAASTRGVIATTDFLSYPADLHAALSTSPQVDSGAEYYGIDPYDISDAICPNYNNGGAEAYDVGAYEFDHEFGPHPASHVLTLTNVVVGSRIHVSDQAGTVVHYDDIAASSIVVITQTVYGDSRDNWRIRVRHASSSPTYQPYETLMTAAAGSSSIYVSQIPDE